jgi:uncharacterized protein YceK
MKCSCEFCVRRRRKVRRVVVGSLLLAIAIWACIALFSGCTSTVTPDIVVPQQASYSGNERNSGLISHTDNGWVVDGNFRNRYNALIEIYGREYAVQRDAGIAKILEAATPAAERWLIDRQHFDLMLAMNEKKHSGILPTK